MEQNNENPKLKILYGHILNEFPNYQIFENGDVYSDYTDANLIPQHNGGYLRTNLVDKDGVRRFIGIHQLVALAFIPNPENKPTVNHKDTNPLNNDVSNLEWATYGEQAIHAVKNGCNKHKKN